MGKPHKPLNPQEQLREVVNQLASRMDHAEKKVGKLHDVCRLQQDFCDNWEVEQQNLKHKMAQLGGPHGSQSSVSEMGLMNMKPLDARAGGKGGDQIYKVLKDKLADFDSQLTGQMDEMERRLKRHVEVAQRGQNQHLEQVQVQINKLGEELAFDVNRIEKESKKAIQQVEMIKKDRKWAQSLLEQQTGIGTSVLQPLRELESRMNTIEFNKANSLEFEQLEQKFIQVKTEFKVLRGLQKGNSRAIEKIAQNIYKEQLDRRNNPVRDASTNEGGRLIAGGKLVKRRKGMGVVRRVRQYKSNSSVKQRRRDLSDENLNAGGVTSLHSSQIKSRSNSHTRRSASGSVSTSRHGPVKQQERSGSSDQRKMRGQIDPCIPRSRLVKMRHKTYSNISQSSQDDVSEANRPRSNGIPAKKLPVRFQLNEAPTHTHMPIADHGNTKNGQNNSNSSKQVSFVAAQQKNKKKQRHPKMMNLDPSTHFANELDEFRHIEEEVTKADGQSLQFSDEEDCQGELLAESDEEDLLEGTQVFTSNKLAMAKQLLLNDEQQADDTERADEYEEDLDQPTDPNVSEPSIRDHSARDSDIVPTKEIDVHCQKHHPPSSTNRRLADLALGGNNAGGGSNSGGQLKPQGRKQLKIMLKA